MIRKNTRLSRSKAERNGMLQPPFPIRYTARVSTKKIATSTMWQMGSQIVMAAMSILTTRFVAMALSKELAGNYNTAYSYLQLFGILADFGLYAVAVREVSKAQNRGRVLGALIVLRSCILAISLGAALFFVWINPQWRGTPLPLSVTIAATVPLFTLLAGILRTAFQVEYKMHFVFIAEVTQRIITLSCIGAFIALGFRDSIDVKILYTFLAIGGMGAFVLLMLSLLYGNKLIRIRPRWDPPLLKSLLLKASPYGFAFLCTALYRQFDVTLIAMLRPDYEIQNAYYGFVQRMMDMAYLLPTFLLNSTLPQLAERDAEGKDTRDFLGKIFMALMVLGSTSFLFAALWPRALTQLLTTDRYLSLPGVHPGSDTALGILAYSMFFNGIVLFCFYVMLTRNAWRPLIKTLGIGVVLSLTLNYLLIPSLGFVGASMTSAVTHAVLAILLLWQSIRVLPIRITKHQWKQWLQYSVCLALPLFLFQPFLVHPMITVAALIAMTVWMAAILSITGMTKILGAKE